MEKNLQLFFRFGIKIVKYHVRNNNWISSVSGHPNPQTHKCMFNDAKVKY